ncbi:MAG: hypothetical protein IKF82_00545 [Bacilli bacterium]|nr:hypothetical protein [Bacilli bacterium]
MNKIHYKHFNNQEDVDQYILATEELATQCDNEEIALKLLNNIECLKTVENIYFVPAVILSWEEMALSYVTSTEMDDSSDLAFVLSSVRRMNIVTLLSIVNIACGAEIADTLFLSRSAVTNITKDFVKRNIVTYIKSDRFKFYQLTPKGYRIAQQIEGYYGFNTE